MGSVFVSHSSKDREIATRICEALEAQGIRCWIASRDINPGENFGASIVRAIRAAKVMLLVFSQNASASDEIKKELVLAGQYRLTVIPARVEDVEPEDAFAYELSTRQWIDLFADFEREIARLGVWILNSIAVTDLAPGSASAGHGAARDAGAVPTPPAAPPVASARREVHAREELGGYARHAHALYEGTFLLYRRSYSRADLIFRSVVEIDWSVERGGLGFTEYYESGKDHPEDVKAYRGDVHISAYTGLVHLVTIQAGSVRTMTMTRMRNNDPVMRGLVLTQSDAVAFFQPTVSSVVIRKTHPHGRVDLVQAIALIAPEADDFTFASDQLALTESQIIRLRLGTG